jgi:MFS family permease
MCPFGGLLAGYLLDKIGRKRTLYFINIISLVSWLILGLADTKNELLMFAELMVSRVIIGEFKIKI